MTLAPGLVLAQRYRADALLGRGGMGEVWRCRDLEQERDVAVKALRKEVLADAARARLFQSEVVAVARLGHPAIVPVYDLCHDGRAGALLVMELREGTQLGALLDEDPPFHLVREVLAEVLGALAYAHARGVLHLDIKPENVLFELRAGAPRVTLLDFGIARVRRPGRGVERWFERNAVIGTIEYMAPEQCTGAFERIGPWTDLFSVGAVAFELCSGRRPFPGTSDHAGLVRRLREPPPRLVPVITGVPAGFGDLCAALLAVDPRDRPSSAADVLAALRALDAPAEESAPRAAEVLTRSSSPSAETLAFDTRPRQGATTAVVAVTTQSPEASTAPVWAAAPAAPATEVEQAFTAEAVPPPAGAYGLFGLRDLPVLGRPEERRAVWSAVRDAALEKRARIVLLEGPAGVGKSRLARDAVERAVELGLCTPMQTSWSPEGSGDEGLRGLIENLLDTRGAPAPMVQARLDFWADRLQAERLRRSPGADRDEGRAAFARDVGLLLRPPRDAAPDAGLPLRVALEAIVRAAAVRPVILWLDDVQWSRGEAAALLGAIREHRPALPVCAIATARTEEIADRAGYELSAALPGTERVLVDKLDREATRRLVQGLLEVDDALGELLAARAEGNPLFVSLLLRQLVIADAVRREGGRYRLRGAHDPAAIPGDIGALIARRIDHAGAARRELTALALVRDRVSLEVARVLGEVLGPAVDEAIARALAAGLLRVEGGAYCWDHGLTREHLLAGLVPEEAPALHAAAAAALLPLVDREDVQEERAHHLRAAGELREAAAAMLDAGLWSLRRAAPEPRRDRFELAVTWAREARHLDLEARAQAELGFAHAEVGDAKRAAEALAAAKILVTRGAGSAAAAWVAFRTSQTMRLQGRTEEGARLSQEARDHARNAGLGEVERLALLQLGVDACRSGDVPSGRRMLEEAAASAQASADRVAESMALRTLTYFVDPAEATSMAERAMDLARAAGATRMEIIAKQVWVDLLHRTGDREAARREARALSAEAARCALRQTVSLLELQGAAWAISAGDWDDARAHRDAAARWGAAAGAVVERMVLAATGVCLALRDGDEGAAAELISAMEATSRTYGEPMFHDLVRRAMTTAPPALADRLRPYAPPV